MVELASMRGQATVESQRRPVYPRSAMALPCGSKSGWTSGRSWLRNRHFPQIRGFLPFCIPCHVLRGEHSAFAPLRIPMKADTCSNPCRTPFRSCRTVVGAKRRSLSLINGCPTGVKISPSVLPSFGAPSRGDAWTIHPKTSSRRLFGQAVSGGNQLPNSSSGCRRSLRVTDSPARPNRRALD